MKQGCCVLFATQSSVRARHQGDRRGASQPVTGPCACEIFRKRDGSVARSDSTAQLAGFVQGCPVGGLGLGPDRARTGARERGWGPGTRTGRRPPPAPLPATLGCPCLASRSRLWEDLIRGPLRTGLALLGCWPEGAASSETRGAVSRLLATAIKQPHVKLAWFFFFSFLFSRFFSFSFFPPSVRRLAARLAALRPA